MPSKKDRIIALVKERGPIDDEAIYRALRPGGPNDREVRMAIFDDGGMRKEDGDKTFYVIPASPEERDAFGDQGYVPIRIRGR